MRLAGFVARFLTVLPLLAQGAARADDFYKGKTITIVVTAPAGGTNDFYARLFAAHLPPLIPGHPTIVVQNMPGAGGMIGANYLYNSTPKDGTYLGSALNTVALNEVLSPDRAKYQSEKFTWIGRSEAPVHTLVAWTANGLRSVADAEKRDVQTASEAPGTASQFFPNLANAFVGTRFKLVSGYEGAGNIRMALSRGEVEASGSDTWAAIANSQPDWVREKKIIPLFQIRFKRDATLPDTPTLLELVHDPKGRAVISFMTSIDAIGFNLMGPPGIPADRVALLRSAFDKMVADPTFAQQVQKAGDMPSPMAGSDLQKLVDSIHLTPKDIVADFLKAATLQP
jgi:tripartite-type tricarboxylate transporter receptor subunit TctC